MSTTEDAPQRGHGRLAASTAPGLGIRPRLSLLGEPVVEVGQAANELGL